MKSLKIKIINIAIIISMAIGISACSSVPSCDDSDVTELVTKIIKDEQWALETAKISYKAFRTENKNDDTKKVTCRAMMEIDNIEYDIRYTAQYTDDGMVYVNLGY